MAKVSLRAYNREIESMVDRGQVDEAIAHCRHILKTYPKHLETYRLLGKAYLEAKRNADAADIFSRILVAVPNDFVANVGMSIIRDEENRLEDSIWHMERAFETQPSNPAVQAELQRLYARRDGVRPPRIRMTRGALAHMYVQGELYPQAISEIKSVLKDDPERADMQALLARAAYRSGSKNEAADIASALLRRYPYSLDANRVLVELLGSDRPENTQVYRQRVFELDPYAALVTGSIFLSHEVSDAAVNVERLEWDGQPVAMQPDWSDTKAISLESGPLDDEQPDWLSQPADSASFFGSSAAEPKSIFGSEPAPEPPPAFGGIQSAPASIFGSSPPPEQPTADPAEDIPDFMRAAGWGKSTGMFDESKSVFGDEGPKPDESIEQGDLPEWVRAMKPVDAESSTPQEEEELPDWITSIGVGALASQAGDQPTWLDEDTQSAEAPPTGMSETTEWLSASDGVAQETPSGDLPAGLDWLKQLDEAKADDLDWMKDLGTPEAEPSTAQGEPDWLKSLDAPEPVLPEARHEQPDWLKDLGEPETTASEDSEGQPDWLKGLALAGGAAAISHLAQDDEPEKTAEPEPDSEFLNQLSEEPVPGTPQESAATAASLDKLGTSEREQDDSFAWLESLAAKQGATEGLLTTPEERLEEEPEWVKQAKGLTAEPSISPKPAEQPAASLDDLGKSEQEQDDSFAWLENLAARQGATEGLLTTPEERLDEEPEWVKQARDLSAQEPPQAVTSQPETEAPLMERQELEGEALAAIEQPESQAEQPASDDVEAWLKNLEGESQTVGPATVAGVAGAAALWLKGQEDKEMPPAEPETPAMSPTGPEPQAEQPAAQDVEAWLRNLEGEQQLGGEPAGTDETAMWLKGLEETQSSTQEPAAEGKTDLPDWLENIQVASTEESTSTFAEEAELGSTWMPPTEEPAPVPESKAEEESLPSWLSELDKEEDKIATTSDASDLPAWLLADETDSTIPEPTIFSDWKSAGETEQQPAAEEWSATFESEEHGQPFVSGEEAEPEPVPVMETPPAPEPEPVAAAQLETVGLNIPLVDPVLGTAREDLSQNNIPGALDSYGKLIKKARYLDEVIYDLREALYRHPVDVNIWQSLGDAYMRANRLQDALDAYTKAEELLR